LLSKLIKSKSFIAITVTVMISSSTLFWITTANSNFFSSFILDDEAKYRQNSLSPDHDNNGIGKDYYLRGGAALNETAYAEGKQLSVKNERYLYGTPFASFTQYIERILYPSNLLSAHSLHK
jgi:hypothetical protein